MIAASEAAAEDLGVEDSSFEVFFVAFNFVVRAVVGVVDCFMAGFLVVRRLVNIPFVPLRRSATSGGGRPSHPIFAPPGGAGFALGIHRGTSPPCRPFLPARDFGVSKHFSDVLGFVKELDAADVAIYQVGASSFLLQKHYQAQWAENFMMQLMVDDIDAWWSRLRALELPARFGVPEPKPPALQP